MGKLKIVDDAGVVVYEFNDAGYFGVIDNTFLIDLACGQFDKSEIKVACFLMSTAGWDNKIDSEVSKGAKIVGITYKAYADVLKRLTDKKVLILDDEILYFNPEKFRRRTIKKKKAYIPWNSKFSWPEENKDGEGNTD